MKLNNTQNIIYNKNNNLEISIKNVFIRKEFPHIDRMTEEQYLLKNVVQAVADKLYVETKFLSEVKEKEETK